MREGVELRAKSGQKVLLRLPDWSKLYLTVLSVLYKELGDTSSRPAVSLTRPVYEANSRIHQQIEDYIFFLPSHIHIET